MKAELLELICHAQYGLFFTLFFKLPLKQANMGSILRIRGNLGLANTYSQGPNILFSFWFLKNS